MIAGMDQTEEDVDGLEAQLEGIDPGTTVILSWASPRSGNRISATGTAMDSDDHLFIMTTSSRKRRGRIYAYRNGALEISAVSTGSPHTKKTTSMGWVVDVQTEADDPVDA